MIDPMIVGTIVFGVTYFFLMDHEDPDPSVRRLVAQVVLALIAGWFTSALLAGTIGYSWDGNPEPHM